MAASQWPGWDEDQLAMLKDSYREVLGVAMPPDMDPAKATEYLRKQFEVLMGDPGAEEEEEGETRVMLFSVILAAAKLKKAMLRARAAKQREARQAEKKAAEQAALEQQATAHGWDPEQLDMLRQSYMEVTGREMPPWMAPFEAVQELRRLVPNVGAPDDTPQDTVLVIIAAAKLKRRWLEGRRKKLAAKAAAHGLDVKDYKGPAVNKDDWVNGRVKEMNSTQFADEEAAAEEERRRSEEERVQAVRANMKKQESKQAVFKPTTDYVASGTKVHEGWLLKKNKGFMKSDKNRWFVLHSGGELHYFVSPKAPMQQVGMISLKGLPASCVKGGDAASVFVIEGADRLSSGLDKAGAHRTKDWALDAGSESTRTAWVKQIKKVING